MRRARRNRKRPEPFWRRLPAPGICARAAWHGIRRSMPAIVVTASACVLFLSGYFGYRFVTSSARFDVAAVEVRGNRILSDARVRAVLGLDPAARYNIFRLDLETMRAALEAEPWVAGASLQRELPATLLVDIEENQPAALVEMDGLYLTDATGQVFLRARVERGDGDGLPVITGITREQYVDDPAIAQAAIRRALAAAEMYADGSARADGSRPGLGEIHIDPRRGITFFTYDTATAVRVGHGSLDVLGARLRAFDAAWQALQPEERARVRVVYADTSPRPDRVTVGFEENR